MKTVDEQYFDLVNYILEEGDSRDTRSGKTISIFDYNMKFDLRKGLPLITTKKLALRALLGELLWFLSGETTISSLQKRTFGKNSENKKTIWTPDFERWVGTDSYNKFREKYPNADLDDLGPIYGKQWSKQLNKVVNTIKTDHTSRYLVVDCWSVEELELMCLPPCHYSFQFYVSNGYLDLKWIQRSVDVGLGLVFNISSYAVLLELIAKECGLKARYLSCSLGDTHIYENSIIPLLQQRKKLVLQKEPAKFYSAKLPDNTHYTDYTVEQLLSAIQYDSHEQIKIDVQVG